MALDAQNDLERAGLALTETKFTTEAGVDVYLYQLGSRFIGVGPGDPDGDLELDEEAPYAAGSLWINTTTGSLFMKGASTSVKWWEFAVG